LQLQIVLKQFLMILALRFKRINLQFSLALFLLFCKTQMHDAYEMNSIHKILSKGTGMYHYQIHRSID